MDRAAAREPATSSAALRMRTRRLPIMSARRPPMGIATAAASSVAVMTQEAFAVEVFSSCGSSGWIGITSDCMSAATMPPKHRMITVTSGWFRREPLGASAPCPVTVLVTRTTSLRGETIECV